MSNKHKHPTDADKPYSDSADDLFEDYDAYAKIVRTWFVAYGVGGPVLLLTNANVQTKIAASGCARGIASAFLVGVGLQIFLALLNKTALWLCYMGARYPSRQKKLAYRFCMWVIFDFWIEFLLDAASFVLFAWATYRVFVILTAS